ncbi:unnamed protein product, partial [Amoebophrya sp. A120]|eukprot:GSA120T00021872001.1
MNDEELSEKKFQVQCCECLDDPLSTRNIIPSHTDYKGILMEVRIDRNLEIEAEGMKSKQATGDKDGTTGATLANAKGAKAKLKAAATMVFSALTNTGATSSGGGKSGSSAGGGNKNSSNVKGVKKAGGGVSNKAANNSGTGAATASPNNSNRNQNQQLQLSLGGGTSNTSRSTTGGQRQHPGGDQQKMFSSNSAFLPPFPIEEPKRDTDLVRVVNTGEIYTNLVIRGKLNEQTYFDPRTLREDFYDDAKKGFQWYFDQCEEVWKRKQAEKQLALEQAGAGEADATGGGATAQGAAGGARAPTSTQNKQGRGTSGKSTSGQTSAKNKTSPTTGGGNKRGNATTSGAGPATSGGTNSAGLAMAITSVSSSPSNKIAPASSTGKAASDAGGSHSTDAVVSFSTAGTGTVLQQQQFAVGPDQISSPSNLHHIELQDRGQQLAAITTAAGGNNNTSKINKKDETKLHTDWTGFQEWFREKHKQTAKLPKASESDYFLFSSEISRKREIVTDFGSVERFESAKEDLFDL